MVHLDRERVRELLRYVRWLERDAAEGAPGDPRPDNAISAATRLLHQHGGTASKCCPRPKARPRREPPHRDCGDWRSVTVACGRYPHLSTKQDINRLIKTLECSRDSVSPHVRQSLSYARTCYN
jgi:hypothetical protein